MTAQTQTSCATALLTVVNSAQQRLVKPGCDPRTIAKQLEQISKVVLADMDSEKPEAQ